MVLEQCAYNVETKFSFEHKSRVGPGGWNRIRIQETTWSGVSSFFCSNNSSCCIWLPVAPVAVTPSHCVFFGVFVYPFAVINKSYSSFIPNWNLIGGGYCVLLPCGTHIVMLSIARPRQRTGRMLSIHISVCQSGVRHTHETDFWHDWI